MAVEGALLACWIAATSALLLHGTTDCLATDAWAAAGTARAAVPASSTALA
jgi:hypothetical protein